MENMELKAAKKLEIVILTYNRAQKLAETLEQFVSSPFKYFKITVQNNKSDDNTLEICEKYIGKLPLLIINTNKLNIGASANYLRAVENSTSLYTWIICDDDKFDFSNLSELFEAINNEYADLFFVGAHERTKWIDKTGLYTPLELIRNGFHFFRYASFWPCSIFRTQNVQNLIRASYNYIPASYINMPYIFEHYLSNKPLYVFSNRIAIAQVGEQFYDADTLIEWWIKTSSHLEKKKDQLLCFEDQFIAKSQIHRIYMFIVLKLSHKISRNTYKNIKKMYGVKYSILFHGIYICAQLRIWIWR
jgi:glycosyltransferase involved in cell wall biosynthesis